MSMTVMISSPANGVVFDGAVDKVHFASDLGDMEVYPGHATLVGTSRATPVVVARGGHEEVFFVENASILVDRNADGMSHVAIAALTADKQDAFDVESLRALREKMARALEQHEALSKYQMQFIAERLDSLDVTLRVRDVTK